MRIIFMGTPDFAVESLRQLVESGHKVVAVITAPDKPAGRGLKLMETPVKRYATSVGIPVLQPEKLKNKQFLAELRSYRADLQIVVAFRMLPEVVWNMPPQGTFNLHASLLPQYRGAAPINWAIINGETETGVTTFFLQHEIDTGAIIFQAKTPILPEDTAGSLHDRLMHLGADLVVKTANAIQANDYPQTPQPMAESLAAAPKLFKETTEIDWQQPAQSIVNFIRGLSPYPAAWMVFEGKMMKVYAARQVADEPLASPTQEATTTESLRFRTDGRTYLHLQAPDDWVALEEIQLEGKKRLPIADFLRGYRF